MADILISQLPRTEAAGDADLLIIDSFDATSGGIVTQAIKWSDLYAKISSFPQGIKFPDGTAIQPSITFVNDTNTGFYRVGEDKIGVSTNGLPRVVVDGNGNVGINTLNPEQKLHVQEGNVVVRYGTTNELYLGEGDGGMVVKQTQNVPLTFGTNDLTRMTISPDGRILVNTTDLDSDSMFRVNGVIQAGTGTLSSVGGVTALGVNTNTTTNVLFLNSDGAIGNKNSDYGTAGQALLSGGPGQPWYWGAGGGGGGGGTTLKGEINVTLIAPLNPSVGDFYLNNTNGNAHPSFGTTEYVTVNAFVTYSESGWIIQNQNLSGYVDLTTDQTVGGTKTFTDLIIGTAQNCSRSVNAAGGLIGGGELTQDIGLSVNAGEGLAIVSDAVAVKASDNTIAVDAGGIRVDTSEIFSNDPNVAAGVTSFNGRKGAVLPVDNDYYISQLFDVDTTGASEGQVLTRQGSLWVPKQVQVEGSLSFQGDINATVVTAPAALPGQFWVQKGANGLVLNDASWGILAGEPVNEGDMIAKSPDVDGQPPQWAVIGNTGGGAGGNIASISAQNGVTNSGSNENLVLEADLTVVRTTSDQTIDGVKTFNSTIEGSITGDAAGTATNCSRSVLAGDGLGGGGILSDDITLSVTHDVSLAIVNDLLSVVAGDGLQNGADGTGGALQIDTDWLNDNYTPDVSGLIGDGQISLIPIVDGGIAVIGDNATANQTTDTSWQIALDQTVMRTDGDYIKNGNLALLDVLPD